jgi:hypothetical protein
VGVFPSLPSTGAGLRSFPAISRKPVDLGRKLLPPMKTTYKRSVSAIEGFKGSFGMLLPRCVRVLGLLKMAH